jgi:acyl-CoA thioester hydrolase
MYTHETTIRVRYAETDQMGIVYYGNYPQYYEVGRVEAIRSLGISYKEMEDHGIFMPVTKMNIKYVLPAKYDDLLKIVTMVKEKPDRRIHFKTEIYNEADDLLNFGEISLAFVDAATKKVVDIPDFLWDKMKPFFNH